MKAVVRAACAALFVLPFFLPAIPACAQVTATAPVTLPPEYNNRWDLYGGFQYSHFNPGIGRNVPATNLFGWNGTATVYFHPQWGIEMGYRGLHGTMTVFSNPFGVPPNPAMSENLVLFGPTFRIFRRETWAAGAHVLVGSTYGDFDKDFPSGVEPNAVNIYNDKLAFAGAIGGWFDHNLSPKLSVRVITDYQPTHYGYGTQSEFAGSIGIVYKLGTLKK